MLRVLHLVGAADSEFYADLSRLYAADCLRATHDPTRYEFHVAHVEPGGLWRFPGTLEPERLAAAVAMPLGEAVRRIVALSPDVVVPQMFDRAGMTSYRGLFDLLGIPYVGNTATVMAIGADKAKARAVVAAGGVDVPGGEVLRPGQRPTRALPVVVKPVGADNSLGISLVRDAGEWDAALAAAFEHDDAALVEDFVPLGREMRCGVLERDGELLCLPLEEYDVDAECRPIRTVADKLRRGDAGDLQLVAKERTKAWIVDPSDPVTAPVWAAARRAYVALGCRHYGLFDFRIDPAGRPWFLEAGLYCSFARQSVVAVMAAAAGIDVTDLFAAALDAAVRA